MKGDVSWQSLTILQRWALVGAGATIASLIGWFAATRLPGPVDYYYTFYPLVQFWLQGHNRLFELWFHYPPWTIWYLVLFGVWPFTVGVVLLWATSLLMLAATAIYFARVGRSSPWACALALVNLHTFDLLFRGQLNATEALGVLLGWVACQRRRWWLLGLAYVVLMISPPNTIPVAIFLLALSIREWRRREIILSLIPPLLVITATFIVFGIYWPLDYYQLLQVHPVQVHFITTLWRARDQLGWSPAIPIVITFITLVIAFVSWLRLERISHVLMNKAQMAQTDLARLVLLITTTMVVTPYALSYRYVLLLVIVMPYLAQWRLDVVFGLYALTFLPLLRLVVGADNAWIDIVFAMAVFAATILRLSRVSLTSGEPLPVAPGVSD